jgi:carboxymethylenebutenolidase
MLIKSSYKDVPTTSNGKKGTMRVHILEPNVPDYPDAKFPGCVVFSEIYQVTGPVERCVAIINRCKSSYHILIQSRFGGNIASEGYIVALPCVFHEFEGPEPISYDTQGTDKGNSYKVGG